MGLCDDPVLLAAVNDAALVPDISFKRTTQFVRSVMR